MSIIDTVKSFLQPQQHSNFQVVSVSGPVDYESVPKGFFNVETASGKKSLGYRGNFISWQVGTTVVDGAERVTLSVPRSELPTVRLNFQRSQDGVQHIGGSSVIDTDSLEGDSSVAWGGAKPASGVAWR